MFLLGAKRRTLVTDRQVIQHSRILRLAAPVALSLLDTIHHFRHHVMPDIMSVKRDFVLRCLIAAALRRARHKLDVVMVVHVVLELRLGREPIATFLAFVRVLLTPFQNGVIVTHVHGHGGLFLRGIVAMQAHLVALGIRLVFACGHTHILPLLDFLAHHSGTHLVVCFGSLNALFSIIKN